MADSNQDRGPHRRGIGWLVAMPLVLVLGASVILVNVIQHTGPYHVGSCFRMGKAASAAPSIGGLREVRGRAIPVSCATPHDAEITRAVRNPSACVDEGAWLTSLDQIYCVTLLNAAG
jgi:hypothetical protein